MTSDQAAPEGYQTPPFPIDEGFSAQLGPFYVRDTDDKILLKFFATSDHANPGGALHAGVLASFASNLMMLPSLKATGGAKCSLISLNTDFLSGGKLEQWVDGWSHITRQTKDVLFVQAELSQVHNSGDRRMLMTASGLVKIIGS